MRVKDLPLKANVCSVKLRVPQDGSVKQLTDNPIKEGWIVSMYSVPGGWFMSASPPDDKVRHLIPTYGSNEAILEWELAEDITLVLENGTAKIFTAEPPE